MIPAHPLTNVEIEAYYCQNKPKFNGVYIRDNLSKTIKNGAYVINLDEYSAIETHWIGLYVNNKTANTLIALELSTFQKKSKNLLIIKT